MKNVIKILLATTLLFSISEASFAHDEEKHKKQDQTESTADTSEQMQYQHADVSSLTSEHEHDEMQSAIVEAEFSDFPNLHPLLVHFPIVLLLLAFFSQLAAFFFWKKELSLITGILLLGGFIGAYLVSTVFHPHTGELSNAAQQVLDLHDRYADFTIWTSGIAFLLKLISHFLLKRKLWMEILVVVAIGGAAFSISKAGHYGATLVHLHGVGPQGKYLEVEDGHTH